MNVICNSRFESTFKVFLQIAIDRMVELYPGPVALRSVSILEALVYKMSAPYRYLCFLSVITPKAFLWDSQRRFLSKIKRLLSQFQACKILEILSSCAKGSEKIKYC